MRNASAGLPDPAVDDARGVIEALEARRGGADGPEIDVELVRRRHQAFAVLDRSTGRPTWPPTAPDPFDGRRGLPEVGADELDAATLAGAIVHHGCLIVRGLLSAEQSGSLREDIDRALEARDRSLAGAPLSETSPWYVPFTPDEGYPSLANARQWVHNGGGIWSADSPRTLCNLFAVYRSLGLDTLIAEHLGEQPALSVKKSTLRRVRHDLDRADWHQDGAFLDRGAGIRTVNVWLALTPCGIDAPGLELFPGRLDDLAETGTNGAWFDWSVGPGTVESLAAGAPIPRPSFAAGDAVLFDELNLHRTAIGPDMTEDRYAIESWFFAPSHYPPHHVPIVF